MMHGTMNVKKKIEKVIKEFLNYVIGKNEYDCEFIDWRNNISHVTGKYGGSVV